MKFKTRTRQEIAATDLVPVAAAVGLILLSGLLISMYTVILQQAALRTGSQDNVRNAAMMVAGELSKVTVSDASFGEVGICDRELREGDTRRHITSINRLYATLRLDEVIAKKLQLPYMSRMVGTDFNQVKKLDELLRQRLQAKAQELQHRAETLARASNRANEKMLSLQIKLGYLKSTDYDSGMPLVDVEGTEKQFGKNGNYAAGVPVPISGGGAAQFYQLAPDTRFVNELEFAEAKPGMTPSVVLIEAVFKLPPSAQSNQDLRQTRSVAVMLGGADTSAPHSVLMVDFPQGMPKMFHSLRALTSANSSPPASAWQQAVEGNVPGTGHLIAPQYGFDSGFDMVAPDAIQVSFYHWIRSLGPTIKPDAVDQVFNTSWATEEPHPLEGSQLVAPPGPNSALTKDTGARRRAFYFQANSGGDGQLVLRTAFEAQPNRQALPNSAVPLIVDDTGNCNLPGNTGFDRKLVADLLEAVYETNLVANESLGLAKSIVSRMERAEAQVQQTIDVTNEELGSITGHRARIENSSAEPTPELKRLLKSEQELTSAINVARAKLTEYQQVKARANTVIENAEAAGRASFDLCSNMANYAADGVMRVARDNSFLLGNVYVFHPIVRSVTEDEIYRGRGSDEFWLQSFSVLEPAPERIAIQGRLQSNESAGSERNRAQPRFVLLDSRELLGTAAPRVLVLDRSPFADSAIPAGQLCYYAENALLTGDSPTVGWSLLVRDVVANHRDGGEPLPSRHTKWCLGEERAVSECPGLAVEIQLRSPVPLIPDLPVGSFVVSPANHERVSQIPPMPASMF